MNNYESLLKEYEEQDRDAIIAFVSRLREETYGSPPPSISDLKDILNNYFIFLYIKIDDKIIGTCGLARIDADTGEIKRMYIERDFRRSGCGSFLMGKVFDYANKNKIKKIKLYTSSENKSAIDFYKKVGFIQTREGNGKTHFERIMPQQPL